MRFFFLITTLSVVRIAHADDDQIAPGRASGAATTTQPTSPSPPASQSTSQPAARPPAPEQQVDREPARGAGDACRVHSDCMRPLFCVDQLCTAALRSRQPAPPAAHDAHDGASSGIGHKGSTSIGGSIGFSIDTAIPDHGDSVTGFQFELSPSLGFFVIDNLAIGFALVTGVRSGDLYEGLPTNVAIGVSLRRLFGDSGPRFYIGAGLGPEFLLPSEGDALSYFVIAPELGVLIPLNDHVAIDLGVRPTFSVGIGDVAGTLVRVPFIFGVAAFF